MIDIHGLCMYVIQGNHVTSMSWTCVDMKYMDVKLMSSVMYTQQSYMFFLADFDLYFVDKVGRKRVLVFWTIVTPFTSIFHLAQRRGGVVDFHTDRRGLLWILDEESVFPGASDSSFLDRLHMYHGAGSTERGEPPLIKVIKEDNQFVIYHCQQMLPVLYDANDWLRQAREHPSFRVVVQTLAISKRYI